MRRIEDIGKGGSGGVDIKDVVYFGLESISKGSAMVEISVSRLRGGSGADQAFAKLGLDPVSCVEEAFRLLMEICQGSRREENSQHFQLIEDDIKSFGKNLEAGESIRFVESNHYAGADVVFDTEMGGRLASSYESYSRVVGTGTLDGFKLDGTVFVDSEDYGGFDCSLPPNAVKAELDGNIGSKIEFALEAKLDHHGRIVRVQECHRLELAPKE